MILLLFGPPGCGKGTQSSVIVEHLGIPAISTGEMLRDEARAGTALGKAAASILATGGLLDDALVNSLVASRIARPDCARGFLLDGYPRTVAQARFFSDLLDQRGLPAPVVIHIQVDETALIKRLTARRQCPECHRIYNLLTQPPRVSTDCDGDGAHLITRDDDSEPVIRRRLREYHDTTGRVLDWYGRMVRAVDGNLAPERVTRSILGAVTGGIRNAPALAGC